VSNENERHFRQDKTAIHSKAGHETTAHTLSFVIYALAKYQDIQIKAQSVLHQAPRLDIENEEESDADGDREIRVFFFFFVSSLQPSLQEIDAFFPHCIYGKARGG